MKIQFGIRAMLWAIALGAIWAEAVVLGCHILNERMPGHYVRETFSFYALNAAMESAIWAPLLVVCYAAGRRSVTAGTVVAAALSEAIALLITWAACPFLP